MTRKTSKGAQTVKKCIFCTSAPLTKTHIWPDWLNKLLRPPNVRDMWVERDPRDIGRHPKQTKKMQGSIFTQKPYLACGKCNNGWMNHFEGRILNFAPSLFTSLETMSLGRGQVRSLAGWVALVTTLAEFLDREGQPVISYTDRKYLRKHGVPPNNWTVVVCSSDPKVWRSAYRHYALGLFDFFDLGEARTAAMGSLPNNSLISSFGTGNVFFQTFVCRKRNFVNDFRETARAAGMIQLWPLRYSLWPFRLGGVTFPTKVVLDDPGAEVLSYAYRKRIKMRSQNMDQF